MNTSVRRTDAVRWKERNHTRATSSLMALSLVVGGVAVVGAIVPAASPVASAGAMCYQDNPVPGLARDWCMTVSQCGPSVNGADPLCITA